MPPFIKSFLFISLILIVPLRLFAQEEKDSIPEELMISFMESDTVELLKLLNKRKYRSEKTIEKMLQKAINNRDSTMALFLLRNGAPANTHDTSFTHFHNAISHFLPTVLKMLVEKGADMDICGNLSNNAILFYTVYGNKNSRKDTTGIIFNYLIEEHLKQNIPPEKGRWLEDAFYASIIKNDIKTFRRLLQNANPTEKMLYNLFDGLVYKKKNSFVIEVLKIHVVDDKHLIKTILSAARDNNLYAIETFLHDSLISINPQLIDTLFKLSEKKHGNDVYTYLQKRHPQLEEKHTTEKEKKRFATLPPWTQIKMVLDSGNDSSFLNLISSNDIFLKDASYVKKVLESEKYDWFKIMIDKGANINVRNSSGKSILSIASENKDLELIQYSLNNGINKELFQNELKQSVIRKDSMIVSYLLQNGIEKYNNKEDILNPLLILSASIGNVNFMKLFIEFHAEINVAGFEALTKASQNYHIDASRYLLEQNVPLWISKDTSTEEILLPTGDLQKDFVYLFVDYSPGKELLEAIFRYAVNNNDIEVFNNAIQYAISPTFFNDTLSNWFVNVNNVKTYRYQNSLLHEAYNKGYDKILCSMIAYGAEPTIQYSKSKLYRLTRNNGKLSNFLRKSKTTTIPILTLAIWNKRIDLAKKLIEITDDFSCNNTLNLTLKEGYTELSKMIIKKTKNLIQNDSCYQTDFYRRTPLYFAVTQGYYDLIDDLITDQYKQSKDPDYIYEALKYGYIKIAKKLIESGFKLDPSNSSYLALMVSDNNKEMVIYLINKGASINHEDEFGIYSPPLLVAINENNLLLTSLLIKNGASIEYSNNFSNRSPLANAIKNKNTSIVKYLLQSNVKLDLNTKLTFRKTICEEIPNLKSNSLIELLTPYCLENNDE